MFRILLLFSGYNRKVYIGRVEHHNPMSQLQILFEMQNTTMYNALRSSDLLKKEGRTKRLKDDDGEDDCTVTIQNFATGTFPSSHIFFLSGDYRADVSKRFHAEEIEGTFGPARIFGMGINSMDRNGLEDFLMVAVTAIEEKFPGFKSQLSYIGTYIGDYQAISRESFREGIEKVLKK